MGSTEIKAGILFAGADEEQICRLSRKLDTLYFGCKKQGAQGRESMVFMCGRV